MAKAPKPVRIALAYDSYFVEGETDKSLEFHFEAPHVARAAFAQHLKKAQKQKRLAVTDATRRLDAFPTAQLEWQDDRVTRAWFTADELDAEHVSQLRGTASPALRSASEQLTAALALAEFAGVEELGVGLERWNDSHKFPFDDALAVMPRTLRALSLGDYDNRSGHILQIQQPAKIAELYPSLEKLRITTTSPPAFEGVTFAALHTLSLRTKNVKPTMAWCFDLPALRHLALSIDEKLLRALVAAPIFARLESLTLLDVRRDHKVAELLRKKADAFKHLELRIDSELRDVTAAVVPTIDRYRDSRE